MSASYLFAFVSVFVMRMAFPLPLPILSLLYPGIEVEARDLVNNGLNVKHKFISDVGSRLEFMVDLHTEELS